MENGKEYYCTKIKSCQKHSELFQDQNYSEMKTKGMNAIENFYFKIHLQYVIITYLGKKLFLELFMKEVLHCHLRASSPCT